MYTIGTAGHVDHGKTLLIKALTGIDTDRLPEEKERGLTIDLGFAFFKDNEGQPVGVIDVPGHERYIRNMVAGAWSLQCALLVVAADDGWMQQSEDHLKVLDYLGVPKIILVITKKDMVSPERIRQVEDEALAHIFARTAKPVPCISVSALNGENIEELRNMILSELKTIVVKVTERPYLYVDRVFTIKGSGTVVTGTLASGNLSRNTDMVVLPENKKVKIRSFQSYQFEVETLEPVSRVALNLQNLKKEDVHRGSLFTVESTDFHTVREFICRLSVEPDQQIRNHSEIEIAMGTTHLTGVIHFITERNTARIVVQKLLPLYWNQPFVIIRHGGSKILGGGRVLWTAPIGRQARLKAARAISLLPETLNERHKHFLTLQVNGYIEKTGTPIPPEHDNKDIIELSSFIVGKETYQRFCSSLEKRAAKAGGVGIREVPSIVRIPDSLSREIIESLLQKKRLTLQNGMLVPPGGELTVSPMGRNLLDQAKKAHKQGLEPSRMPIQGALKECKNLSRLGLLVSLDGSIFFHADTYDICVQDILKGEKKGARFTIPDAKERTSLSRKYIIPLLNRMESDGYVKRDENERIVMKVPDRV